MVNVSNRYRTVIAVALVIGLHILRWQWQQAEYRARVVRIATRVALVAAGLVIVTKVHQTTASWWAVCAACLPMAAFSGGLQLLGQSQKYSAYIIGDALVKLKAKQQPDFAETGTTGEYVNVGARFLATAERSARYLPVEGSYVLTRECLSVAFLAKSFAPVSVIISVLLGTLCQGFCRIPRIVGQESHEK